MQLDLVDVFPTGSLSGNPLAVVRGGEAMEADAMLALTRWLGFSETTFLLPPTTPAADYRVRIFYPAGELPFAGHPTLGSARAWLAAGGVPADPYRIVQECGVGLVTVRPMEDRLAFLAPPLIRSGALGPEERGEAIFMAGVREASVIAAVHACNGPGWKLLHLASAQDVLDAVPQALAPVHTDIGLVGAYPPGHTAAFEIRAFFTSPTGRLVEDPVTGSLNAAAAQYLYDSGAVEGDFHTAQGRLTGADGRVTVSRDGEGVWIGGRATMIAQGAALTP